MQIKIDKIVQGGKGFARTEDGKCVFVEGALPGETVQCRIDKTKKDFIFASAVKIEEPSPERIVPPCPYYSECGGCDFMHLDLSSQLKEKQLVLEENLKRSRINLEETEILSPEASSGIGYRSRVRFHVEGGSAGFYKRNSREIIKVNHCIVLTDTINSIFEKKMNLAPGEFPVMEVDEGLAIGNGIYHKTVLGHCFPVSNRVFFQSNIAAFEKLIAFIIPFFEEGPVLDLYSGVGTFSSFLEENHKVTAVEQNKYCLSLAKMHLKNTDFVTSPVEKWHCRKDIKQAVVDPPRNGLDKTVPALLKKWGIERLVYVSCSPDTFSRDARALQNEGFALKKIKLFDFYPNTSHMETAAVFERNKRFVI